MTAGSRDSGCPGLRAALGAGLLAWTVAATATPAGAQQEHRAILAARFQETLETLAREHPGVLGVQVLDLEGEEAFGVNEGLVFPQGSAIKVAVLVTLYTRHAAGELDVSEAIPVRAADRVGGTGWLRHFGDGTSSLALRDLAVLMITVSDNLATNLLIDRVGMDHVNRTMTGLGLPNTRLQRKMIRPLDSARGRENLSTPAEAATLMARIHRCDLPMDRGACEEMKATLRIRHDGPIQDAVPGDVPVLQKTGTITGVRTSWGLVELPGRPYALAVMGNYGESRLISDAILQAAREAHAYFHRLAGATPYGTRVPVELLREAEGRRPPG